MKKMLQFIPVQLTFCLVLGIIFGYFFLLSYTIISYLLLGLFLLLGFVYWYSNSMFNRNFIFVITSYLLTFTVGVSVITLNNDLNHKNHYSHFLEGENESILIVEKTLKSGNFNDKYEAEVVKVNNHNTIGKVLLNVKKDSLSQLSIDDKIYVKSDFLEVLPPKNPYYFDYGNYLKKQNIYHQSFIENGGYLKLEKRKFSFQGLAHQLRHRINVKLQANGFKGDELAVINALLLGQRQDISPELLNSYAGAGAIHILAVSGLHIGILLLILNFLLTPLERFKRGKLIKLILIVSLLWTFAFIAGMSASVVRAVTMFSAVAIGMLVNRPTNVYNTLVISMFFLLLFNPYFLFEVGFQLSYLAVFSIVWIQPMIYSIWKPKWKVIDYFWQLLTVSIAAQFGVIPLSLYYFHQFPGLFFISNLVIIPVLGTILIGGIVVIILALINMLPSFIAKAYYYLIYTMNYVVDWVAQQEDFLIKNIAFSLLMVILSYLLIVMGIRLIERRSFKRLTGLLGALILLFSVLIYQKYERQSTDELIVFNKSRFSIIGNRVGNNLTVLHTLDSATYTKDNTVNQYDLGSGNLKISYKESISNILNFKHRKLLVIDSLGVYDVNGYMPEIVIIQQSPKINFERMIDLLQPKMIIADASNYKSYVMRWEKTCLKKRTPFHYTNKKGAYIIKD
ncbi:MAG: competence protein ComEC [Saprospiraceae bacterium]|jgi:competence protein ComEC